MFFIYKKDKYYNNSKLFDPVYGTQNVLVLSTNIYLIKTYLLPLYYIEKSESKFLFFYNIMTFRNLKTVKGLFLIFFKKKKPLAFVLDDKNKKKIYQVLILMRWPFLWPKYAANKGVSTTASILDAYKRVRLNYYLGFFKY